MHVRVHTCTYVVGDNLVEEALEKPSRRSPLLVGCVRRRFPARKSLNENSQMIVHDTSLKACATYKCLGVED